MIQNFRKHELGISGSGVARKLIFAIFLMGLWITGFSAEYRVDVKASSLEWHAKKVTGQHMGTIAFGESTLNVEGKKITGGKLSVEMNTLVDTDLTDSGFNQKLTGHLKSDDFFGVAKFPQSMLEVKKVELKSDKLYHFTADLTIKGITAPVEFDAEVQDVSGQITATGVMTVNRTKYGIKYGSGSFFEGLGDKMIYDDFTLNFKLVAVNN